MTEPYKQDKLKEILNYEFNSKGGWVTVKFESGVVGKKMSAAHQLLELVSKK